MSPLSPALRSADPPTNVVDGFRMKLVRRSVDNGGMAELFCSFLRIFTGATDDHDAHCRRTERISAEIDLRRAIASAE